jgi:hypothetical protein
MLCALDQQTVNSSALSGQQFHRKLRPVFDL